jgi:hypothetical protein
MARNSAVCRNNNERFVGQRKVFFRGPIVLLVALCLTTHLLAQPTKDKSDTAAPSATNASETAAPAPSSRPLSRVETITSVLRFVRFPNEDARPELAFCALEPEPELEQTIAAQPVRQRPVRFSVIKAEKDLESCDFILHNRPRTAASQRLVQSIGARAIFLIGEDDGACAAGFALCLSPAGKFGVNLDAIGRSGLRVSSHLLSRARGAKQENK